MATAGKLQDDFLTCSICMEVFQQPVSLACQHSFCKNCLSKYLHTKTEAVSRKFIPCPTCRQETPVPHPEIPVEEWAGQLKPGLLLTGLMDSVKEAVKCSSCKEEGETTLATHWCSECEASFCDACLKMHREILHDHAGTNLAVKTLGQKVRRKFICREHKEKMKLYCKDCKKPLCTVCCSISHRKCEDVVTIQSILPEVKSQLHERQKKFKMQIEETGAAINCYKGKIGERTDHEMAVSSEMKKTFDNILEYIHKKRDQLRKELADKTAEEKLQIRSTVNRKQLDLQMYQQQSQFIQQALELEDEAQLFEMYLSSELAAGADVAETSREGGSYAADVSFILNLGQLKAEIDNIHLKKEVTYVKDEVEVEVEVEVEEKMGDIDLTVKPVLHEVNEAKSHQNDKADLMDIAVLNVKNTKVTVVTDCSGNRIKSFYRLNGRHQCSTMTLRHFPRCIAILKQDLVAVSVPFSQKILTVHVNPDLQQHSEITTEKRYYGLGVLYQSFFVANATCPPTVDILDMSGRVLRTLPGHRNPAFIVHVAGRGAMLWSDQVLRSAVSLRDTGRFVCFYVSTEKIMLHPYGLTSTSAGDILVAERDGHKVVQLSEQGEFIRNILTEQDGLQYPNGLFVDGDKLYVVNRYKGVQVYHFA